MKFGKKLQHQLEHSLPEWRPNFLCYKQLKKRLKDLGSAAPMTFLTAAILDENPSLENGFLIPVDAELANGGEERGLKRGPDDSETPLDDTMTKRGGQAVHHSENGHHPEAREPIVLVDEEEPVEEEPIATGRAREQTERDTDFLRLVKTELHKFNDFFLEKEEEFIIRLDFLAKRKEELEEKVEKNGGVCVPCMYEELIQLRKQIVTLHGEMVLLMNYSSLNYIGLLKILKKYDKHLGANLRQSVHGSVLHQPFFSVSNLKELVDRCLECEKSLHSSFPTPEVKGVD